MSEQKQALMQGRNVQGKPGEGAQEYGAVRGEGHKKKREQNPVGSSFHGFHTKHLFSGRAEERKTGPAPCPACVVFPFIITRMAFLLRAEEAPGGAASGFESDETGKNPARFFMPDPPNSRNATVG